MRRAVVLFVLAACEIQPAPKKQPVPVEVQTPPPPPQPKIVQPTTDDAGPPAPPPIQASEDCIKVASHVVQVFIDTAKDQAQAAVYEQERMQMTRATAEACDKQAWSAAAQKCYLAAKDPPTIKACENKFPPAPPQTRGSGSGAGSSEPTRMGSGVLR